MNDRIILKNRVRELRTQLRLRQADLAEKVGVTRQTILAIEKNRFNPSIRLSLLIARVFDAPLDYVFFFEDGTCPVLSGEDSMAGVRD